MNTEHIGYRYRLYPTADQAAAFTRWAGCARAVWNAGLEQRRTAWRMRRRGLRYEKQAGAELTAAKRALPWLAEPHSDVLQQTLRDLEMAYRRFFRGEAGYPRLRRKGQREHFRIQSRSVGKIDVRRLNRRWGVMRIPKLGWVRFRWTRAPVGEIKHVTVSRNPLGWHASLSCKHTVIDPGRHRGPPVGIDRGVTATVALSGGELRSCPGLGPGQGNRMRRLARKAGRQETARRRRRPGERRRSRRQERTLGHLARLHAREARIRTDFLHNLSCELAKSHGLIAIEDLQIRSMTSSAKGTIDEPGAKIAQKSGLNRTILAQGWGEPARQLSYKTTRAGGVLVKVPAAYSSQTCAVCGHTDPASRQAQRFRCTGCGHRDHADTNAARVILARALQDQEDGGRAWPSQHGEPSSHRAGPKTVNHPEAWAA